MKTKTEFQNRWCGPFNKILPLRAGMLLLCLLAANSPAQTYTVLHTFTKQAGGFPCANLVLDGSTLYGTTELGGLSNNGTIFKVNTDGSGFVTLKHFLGGGGAWPRAGLLLSGTTLYGTTCLSDFINYTGTEVGYGTVFKINTDGSGFTVLKQFNGDDGSGPVAGVTLSGTTLYGTTYSGGGSNGCGTVFKINTDGSGFEVLKVFTNNDGSGPDSDLVLSGATLYGTTELGGGGEGTLFKINTDSSGFEVLKDFQFGEGTRPHGPLVLCGSTLYGTTSQAAVGFGAIYSINTDGSSFTVLKRFNYTDGAWPWAGLAMSGATLYGVTTFGDPLPPSWCCLPFPGCGTIFKINTDGSGYDVLYYFNAEEGFGAAPRAGLVASGGTLYGTTSGDGLTTNGPNPAAVPYGSGKVFSFTLSPPSVSASPENQTVEAGSVADFAIDVTDFPALTYLFYLNGTNLIASRAECWLELTNCEFSQSGAFTAVFTDIFGAVTSAPAMLNVIPAVERRSVPGVKVMGEIGSLLNLDYAGSLGQPPNWLPLETVNLTNPPQFWFDLTKPLPMQRFYRVWQAGSPSVVPSLSLPGMVPAITLTGNIGNQLRLDCINQIGPTDAWVTLDTVTLTNTSQLYFDTAAVGQPARLYRIVPSP